eukprot:jgi/Orpsp1_1/1191697/evm.model.d7180000087894.1
MKFTSVLSTITLLFATKSLAITWEEADAKAREWCSDLTNEEKIAIITGRENMTGVCVGSIDPIERKGFNGLCLQDGPAGVRYAKGTATSWQASINTAATFDRTLLRKVGEAQGNEFYKRGINFALGPALGIQRSPAAGRIWESYGEDPFYVGQCGVEVVKGIQSQGVIATSKHFVGNDQENNRGTSTSNIPEQALWEVYMEPFYRVVKDAESNAIMASYNAINGIYASENKVVLTDYLKEKMGFQGMVMSDWWGTYRIESFGAGLDMNMPGGKKWGPDYVGDSYWGPHIQENIDNGIDSQERLDDAALRVIRSLYKAGQMENFPKVDLYVDTLTEENIALNRKVGADSNVLLKNDDAILPIKGVKKIAVIGKDALPTNLTCTDMKCADGTVALGWGSGTTDFKYVIDPLSAITERAKKDNIEVVGYGEDDAEGGANAAKDA